MVRFEDEKLVIEVDALSKQHSLELSRYIREALIDSLYALHEDKDPTVFNASYVHLLELLKALEVDWDTSLKMIDFGKEVINGTI
jgi:hypothetical protein